MVIVVTQHWSQFSVGSKSMKKLILGLILSVTSMLAIAQNNAKPPVLRIHGSNTLGAHLTPNLLKAWLQSRGWSKVVQSTPAPEQTRFSAQRGTELLDVEVIATGTGKGIADFIAGQCDIAMASRSVSPEERALNAKRNGFDMLATEHVAAMDGVAVVVNPKNPLSSLDMAQLEAIFSGKRTDWLPLNGRAGAIRVLARNDESGTFDAFKAMVLSQSSLSPAAERFASNHQIAEAVARDPKAIGFLSYSEVGASKALAINGGGVSAVAPMLASIATEDYALARRLIFYSRPNRSVLGDDFIQFSLSQAAHPTIDAAGFVSLQVRPVGATALAQAPKVYQDFVRGAQRLSVNFRFNQSVALLDTRAQADIVRLSHFLRDPKNAGVLKLVGFTDDRLKKVYLADSMSETWAELVANGLGSSGVRVESLLGLGTRLPVAQNSTERGRALNRRVEVWWLPATPSSAGTSSAAY